MKFFLFVLGILLSTAVFSQASVLDSITIKELARALVEPNYIIGVYKCPDDTDPLRMTDNNIIPELDTDYINEVIQLNIIKLDRNERIKGTTDSLIFVPIPEVSGHSDPPTFFSIPGSKWLLLLKPVFIDGTAVVLWLPNKSEQDNKNYINSTTLFEISGEKGSFCIDKGKDGGFDIDEFIIQIDEDFVTQIKALSNVIAGMEALKQIEQVEKLRKYAGQSKSSQISAIINQIIANYEVEK